MTLLIGTNGVKIPDIGLIVLTLLLLVGLLANIEQANFVQKFTIWVPGSGIISYAHSLAYSTQKNWRVEKFKDLKPRVQFLAIAAHMLWFALFVWK